MSRIEHNRESTPRALNNRFLFSHHYLERIWQEADDRSEAAQLIADLRGWASGWNQRSLSSVMTTQVQPTLVSLGFNYREPSDGHDPHLLRLYTSYRQENQVGLCYVAHRQEGETDLDSTVKGRHYAAEIAHALREEELSWGLLTDGERWRIYHADELAPYETFLEVDLGQLLRDRGTAGRDAAAYLLHTLFTESAFEANGDGSCALDRHLSTSEKEASAIEKHLSKCIEDVLRDLCQGFVERDGRETYTSDERDEVFRNATVLLYRLLFILYAEARDLLPLEVPAYHAASLDALVEQAAQYVKVTGLPDPDGTQLWQNLSDLCSWINSGDEDHRIPAYNGDLFDDSDKRYIHDYTIADKYLAPALFSLGAIEDRSESGYRRIDYRDLSVRHLGSIYEGLLEYKLFIAQEKRVRRSDGKGGYIFPKLSDTRLKKGEEDQVIEVGRVYFADSAGERKATGTYYTPEYIVDYIVQQTVRRGLEERRASLEEQLPGWLEEVETAPPGERQRLQRVVDQKLLDFVEQEVLTFRVCDPAMGSGHFLVHAVHTITTFIVETLNLTPWENAQIASDPVAWRRRVAKRCLYGVDLNPLAVELAKLSLWLTTVARGKPLNFLDHHMRQGNSLIGARLGDLIGALNESTSQEQERLATGQMSMFDQYPEFRAPLKEATDLIQRISRQIADAAEDVESQAADYERVRRQLKPYRELANLVTAKHFGLDIEQNQLRAIAQRLLEDKSRLTEDHRALLGQAHELARSRSFFHWCLEFPNTFDLLSEETQPSNRKFSAIVSNPPYLGFKEWGSDKRFAGYLKSRYESYDWHADVLYYFVEAGIKILRPGGWMSYITSRYFMRSPSAESLRSLMRPRLIRLIDFGDHEVFPEAGIHTCIWVLGPQEDQEIGVLMCKPKSEKLNRTRDVQSACVDKTCQHVSRSSAFNTHRRIVSRIRERHVYALEDVAVVISGMQTGLDRVYVKAVKKQGGDSVGRDPNGNLIPLETELLYPFVKNSDIECFVHRIRRHCLYVPDGLREDQLSSDYPGVYTFLSSYKQDLLDRRSSFKTIGQENWFEWMHSSKHHFADRKIITPYRSKKNRFSLAETSECEKPLLASIDVSFVIPTDADADFLLALLNSSLLQEVYQSYAKRLGGNVYDYYPGNLRDLPIRLIAFVTPQSVREGLVHQGRHLYADGLNAMDFSGLTRFFEVQLQARHTPSTDLVNAHNALPRNAGFQIRTEELIERSDVVHDLLVFLGKQMVEMNRHRIELQGQVDPFHFVSHGLPFIRLDDAFVLGEYLQIDHRVDLQSAHHDIEGLRLRPGDDDCWILELQAKFRDPKQDWQDWIKEEDGYMIKRQWVPAYRLQLSEDKARFYHYALPRLQDFDNASSFPGGYTRSTLKKLHLTKVPMMPDVDLSELACLDRELSETKRKIDLTDNLIDQIVYRLYGLTEAEIAIVEGQT